MNTVWPMVPLSDLCDVQIGKTPPRARKEYWGPGSPWLSIADMNQGWDLASTKETITELAIKECNCRKVDPGTPLLSFKLSVGKVGIARIPMYTNEAIAHLPIRDQKKLDARFLCRALLALHLSDSTDRAAMGATLNMAKLNQIQIPLPPIEDQLRIADVLDQADALRTKRRAALDEVDALTGSVFIETFGNLASNPKGFPVGTLGDVATFVGGGTPSRAVPEYFTGTICWATSKDMKARFLNDTQEHVTPAAVQSSATKVVPAGTILVVVKSKVLMHRLPIAVSRVDTCFGQDLKGIVVDETCLPSYVATALRMNAHWLLNRARGINTEGLTLDHLRRFPLFLPSKSKQQDFERFADVQETLHQRMSASINELDDLFASLQHRAFRGEL